MSHEIKITLGVVISVHVLGRGKKTEKSGFIFFSFFTPR